MSRRDPRETARAAFALASRPEVDEGTRSAALNRGNAILEKYSLDPDEFEIPGRTPLYRQTDGSFDLGGGMRGKRARSVIIDDLDGLFDELRSFGFSATITPEAMAAERHQFGGKSSPFPPRPFMRAPSVDEIQAMLKAELERRAKGKS